MASANVERVREISEPGVVSARAYRDHLFVSAVTGLSVYDIRDPRDPRRVGRLDLPVAQNEDVDIGGDILLMSDEPAAGAGFLHVIDISDPANPRRLSSYSTWALGLIEDLLGQDDNRPSRGGIGHTVTCIQECRWAYLAGSDAGIEIVDLRDPRRPRFGGRLKTPETAFGVGTHDVQVDGHGLAWIAGGGGTAAYDVTNPARPRRVYRTDRSARGPSLDGTSFDLRFGSGNRPNDLLHHNSLRLPNSSLANPPEVSDPAAPSDVVAITEEDLNRPRCKGAGTFQTWRIGAGGFLRQLDSWRVEQVPGSRVACSAHYFDERDGLVAQGWFEAGLRFLDVSNPQDVKQVGWWVPERSMFWGGVYAPTDPTGQTVYALDHRRGIDVLSIDRGQLREARRPATTTRRASNTIVYIDDITDTIRPGERVGFLIAAESTAPPPRGARIEVTMASQVNQVIVPKGSRLDRETRVLSFPLSSRRRVTRGRFGVRITRAARPGPAIFEARLVGVPDDAMLLDNRFVDRDRIVRRRRGRGAARASAASARFSLAAGPFPQRRTPGMLCQLRTDCR